MCAPQERNSHNVQLNPASHGDAAAGMKKKQSEKKQQRARESERYPSTRGWSKAKVFSCGITNQIKIHEKIPRSLKNECERVLESSSKKNLVLVLKNAIPSTARQSHSITSRSPTALSRLPYPFRLPEHYPSLRWWERWSCMHARRDSERRRMEKVEGKKFRKLLHSPYYSFQLSHLKEFFPRIMLIYDFQAIISSSSFLSAA